MSEKHKSISYQIATECDDEKIDIRINPILDKRQSKWSVSGLWCKIAINRHTVILISHCSSGNSKDLLQHIYNKYKRTEIVSDNLSSKVIKLINGDYLTQNAIMAIRCRPLNIWYGNGVLVVVRARESLVHGEGEQ